MVALKPIGEYSTLLHSDRQGLIIDGHMTMEMEDIQKVADKVELVVVHVAKVEHPKLFIRYTTKEGLIETRRSADRFTIDGVTYVPIFEDEDVISYLDLFGPEVVRCSYDPYKEDLATTDPVFLAAFADLRLLEVAFATDWVLHRIPTGKYIERPRSASMAVEAMIDCLDESSNRMVLEANGVVDSNTHPLAATFYLINAIYHGIKHDRDEGVKAELIALRDKYGLSDKDMRKVVKTTFPKHKTLSE